MPDQAQLLAQRGEREVGVDCRNRPAGRRPRGQPVAQPRPQDAPARERVERPDDLVAGAPRIGERVEPDVDPRLDVPEQLVHQPNAPATNSSRPMTT